VATAEAAAIHLGMNDTPASPSHVERLVSAPSGHVGQRWAGYREGAQRVGTRVLRSWFSCEIVVPFLATRVTLVLVAWLALQSFQDLPVKPGTWEIKANGEIGKVTTRLSADVYPFVNMWSRWDAGWYQSIAEQGYQFVPKQRSSTAFFPLYPLLMRAVHVVSPSVSAASWFLSGIIVSNMAFLVALYYVVLLFRIDDDDATAIRAALYLLVFPTTLFFSAVYSESVFLAVTVATFYYARKEKWWIAGLLGGAATLARSPGVLLFAPLFLEYLMQRRFQWRAIRLNIVALAIIPAALAAQMWYWAWRFGNMMATQDAQSAWGGGWGSLTPPWKPVIRFLTQPFIFNDTVNFSFTLVFVVLTVVACLKLRPSYGLYAASCLLFVTSWGTFESLPRYVLVIFPAFLVLARLGRNAIFDRAYLCVGSGLAAFFMLRFALWRWVA
jgi:Gpi18-like mannosyltransferase